MVLKSKNNFCETQKAFLSIFGPKEVIAWDIVLLEEQKDLVTQVLLQLLEMRLHNVIFPWLLQVKKWKLATLLGVAIVMVENNEAWKMDVVALKFQQFLFIVVCFHSMWILPLNTKKNKK